MVRSTKGIAAAVLLAFSGLAGCSAAGEADASGKSGDNGAPQLGLYTSLPILWDESDDIRGFLEPGGQEHWARELLRSNGSLIALDSLSDAKGALPLPKGAILILAQPRPLTPQENVALDNWVRSGGKVLLFVDPMLTAPSIFALGDARRPQDVAMLSPILARWGLRLEFDEAQQPGERMIDLLEGTVPVNLPGRFRDSAGGCSLEGDGFVADCAVGLGRIVALADAALFEDSQGPKDAESRRILLSNLLNRVSRER